jgi:paraquat-inducible protein A
MLKVQQLGHHTESSILGGIISLLAHGQLVVGMVVLLCSVVFPLIKLVSILVLSAGGLGLRHHHRAMTYKVIEWTGRWGMLDVLLVTILVAALKLGDMIDVSAGPAAMAFTICVVLSLLATACFDPHSLWENRR